ncbi:hypothetical protein MY11210_005171 [Beauveria gryllotalpidicola]
MDDIAIIGLGLRFPGDASSPESLWETLERGESQWSEIPRDRLNINGYYHPSGDREGSISFKGGHFLKGNIAEFDAPFFSIPAAEAKAIDPQQRLLLEVCYEALENAGCTKDDVDGTDTAVYVGSFVKDYEQICLRDPDWQPKYAATGNGIAIMANRISYYFNLHGPSMTIDTGCSGSLVSVHLAAQSLRSGETSLAIAAGAGLILTPNTIMPMTALNFLSPDGKCFTFDARANGYGRGEGVGVVILKRISDAIRDNDTIRAVIRGTRVNQDGRTTGITLPSKEAQVLNIKAVYKAAGLSFSDTAYVECHGTGTQAGDWRELKAISETLGAARSPENPIFVGSIKPNIGHLEGAAGVAGLIKAVLMLEREQFPPHINFETPNPDIDFRAWKVQVSRVARAWPSNLKKRVSVNCFGFGGTNAHMSRTEYTATRSTKHSSPRLCFLFCGQGSQWPRMGLELRCFPVFWNSINSASWYLKTILGSSFDLIEELSKDATDSALSSAHISQPATTAIQIAIVDLLQSLRIEPSFVVGHSSGEIAAAFACGAISREEAWEVAYYRGLAASTLQSELPAFQGGMIAVAMNLNQAISYISTLPESLEVACINSPNSITLSGKRAIIEHASRDLTAQNIRHRILSVDMAYHSTYMKKVEESYVHNIRSVCPSAGRKDIRMFSSVSGGEIQCSSLDASYWGENMVSTVQFSSAMESLMALPDDQHPSIFIEMGPSTVLRTLALDTLATRSTPPEQFFSALEKHRQGMASILNLVGELWSAGYPVSLKSAISRRLPHPHLKCLSNLPSYPWNHTKSYWHESHLSLANRFREFGRLDLIGAPTADSVSFEPRWRGFLRISENPWIQDHQVQKTFIYPAAGMISMVLEGARQLKRSFKDLIGYEIRNMRFKKAIIVPNSTHGVEVALNMRAETDGNDGRFPNGHFTFSIYSKALEKEWEKHATGSLHFCSRSQDMDALFAAFGNKQDQVSVDCTTSVNPRQLYEHLDTVGISYGPMFRNILEVKKGANCCVSKIRVPDTRSKMPADFEHPHLLHPGTLDSMFQTLFALDSVPRIPYLVQSIFVSDNLDLSDSREFLGHAIAKPTQFGEAEARITMSCTDRPLDQVIINGLHFSGELFTSSAESSFLPNFRNLATEIVWREYSDTAQFRSFKHAISLLCHKHSDLSVLQIGGALLFAKCTLLAASENTNQPLRLAKYSYVNQKQPSLRFSDVKLAPFSSYVEQLPGLSSIQSQYDLVLIDGQSDDEVGQARRFLRPGGVMLQLDAVGSISEQSKEEECDSGIDLGWSLADLQVEWCERTGTAALFAEEDESMRLTMRKVSAQDTEQYMPLNIVLLLPSEISEQISLFESQFRQYLAVNYPATSLSGLQLQDAACDGSIPREALYISLLDYVLGTADEGFIFNWSEADFKAFHSLQRSAKTIVWITRGANMTPTAPRVSPIIGLSRTLMSEDSQRTFATFDLSQDSSLSQPRIIGMLVTVCRSVTDPALSDKPRDVDFAEKDGALFIPRLQTLGDLNKIIENDDSSKNVVEKTFRTEDSKTGRQILESLLHSDIPSSRLSSPSHFKQAELGELDCQEVAISFESTILHARNEGDILQRRGIEHGHIFDGNYHSYPSLVKLLTKDRGVDLVYNPTHNDMHLLVACVRRCGIIVHFANSSEHSSSVSTPRFPVAIVPFDLATLLSEDRYSAIEMIHSANKLTANTSLDWVTDPTVNQLFDVSQLHDAMRAASESPYLGSVSVIAGSTQEHASLVQVLQQSLPTPLEKCIYADATYILVGGLGGLGRSIAELLADNGAKNIAFLSRSGASSSSATRFLRGLSEKGVTVKAFAIDICNQFDLQDLLIGTVSTVMPPIAGVFHCAAVIKDAVFDNMTYANWNSGFKPKALGAYNLVEAVEAAGQTPFYIFLSSSAGVIGTRGQANYAAGNAFLDALAKNLSIRGRRAMSLDLGPILGAGMLADDEVILDALRASGFYGIRHDDFLTIIKHAIIGEKICGKPLPPQIVLGVGTGGLMLQNQPADPYWSRTAMYSYLNIVDMPEPDLSAPTMPVSTSIKARLMGCTDAETATNIVCSGLAGMLAKSMNMSTEEIDPSRPPSAYGVDSLVAVGVRNWVFGNCGVDISVFEILSELTVFELSKLVVQKGKSGLRATDRP